MKHPVPIFIFLLCILSFGCSRVPPADDGFVSSTIENRIGSRVEWKHSEEQFEQIHCFIASAVMNVLTADVAIQIALLNNPKIQVFFEELGMSRANLVEAGLLSNPSFAIEVRSSPVGNLATNIEYLITSCVLDIFLIPLRTRLASTEFEQTKLRVANEILNLAFEVKETYYELIAERKKIVYIQSTVELANILRELSSKQTAIGNVNALEFQLAQAHLLEAELEFARSQTEIIRLQERLNRLLGFPKESCLLLPETLPDTDYYGFDLCALESIALNERLDLQVARFEIVRLCQMLGLKEWWTYTNLNVGLAGEREPDGLNFLGPGFSGELPIFNYGQAARLRLYAQLKQAQDHLAELEIRVLSEVREAHKLLMNYLEILNSYQAYLLPTQQMISSFSEELYNVMGLGIDKLLENKRQGIIATQNYTESLKNYLLARIGLDRALGGYLAKLLSMQGDSQ